MASNEKTSKRVATIAGRIMAVKALADATIFIADKKTGVALEFKWKDIRSVAASAVTQAPDKKKKASKK